MEKADILSECGFSPRSSQPLMICLPRGPQIYRRWVPPRGNTRPSRVLRMLGHYWGCVWPFVGSGYRCLAGFRCQAATRPGLRNPAVPGRAVLGLRRASGRTHPGARSQTAKFGDPTMVVRRPGSYNVGVGGPAKACPRSQSSPGHLVGRAPSVGLSNCQAS